MLCSNELGRGLLKLIQFGLEDKCTAVYYPHRGLKNLVTLLREHVRIAEKWNFHCK